MGVTPEELAQKYPKLYHMAYAGTWESIRTLGLLSTSALLERFEVNDEMRADIETRRRPNCVQINHVNFGHAVVRDQKSLIESKLIKAPLTGCTLQEWYELLNGHVFFWLTEKRLANFICAQSYRAEPHLVLTVDTLTFTQRHRDRLVLSPMNSGSTEPFARPRSPAIFMKMQDFPFKERAKSCRNSRVVELAVKDRADLTGCILSADVMECDGNGVRKLRNIFPG